MVRSRSTIATPPGATIKEQLNDRGMSQKEFAARMDMSEKHISRLINGEVQLTPDVALRLETVLGAPAGFWNNLEAQYREKLTRVEAENAMEEDETLVKQLPYKEMAKYGWVENTTDSKRRVICLRRYFEVVKLPLIEDSQITRIACRRLAITEKSDFALLAWAQRARILARDIYTAPINIDRLMERVPDIRKMTMESPAEFCPKIKSLLAECGVALVFVPHLSGSFLQGASFIDGGKIVVGMTTRGRDADKFWFSLFHELAHIIYGHIGKAGGTAKEDEDLADEWARDVLIPREKYEEFSRMLGYTEGAVLQFANRIGIAPGIVVGRLQNEGLIRHNMLNGLKEQYVIV